MQMEQKQAEHIRNQFLSVLDGASKNLKNGVEVDKKPANALNVEFNSNTDFDKNIKYVANMKPVASLNGNEFAKGETDLVTQVSDYFKSIGNKVESKYGTIVLNRTGVKSSVSHGIGRKKAVAFMAVPDVIKNGRIIDYTDNYKKRGYDTAVFSAPIQLGNEDYYVAAVINVEKEKNSFYLHEMAVVNKKEDDMSFKTGTVKHGTPSDISSSIYSLLNKLQNVNKNSNDVKYSLDIDSDGNKLTQQQAEYFKNSKVRDEDGNLFKVYHGTSENFTVFDKTKGRTNMDIQGMFFSPWELDAKGYGSNVNAYYINITNPASEQMGYKALRKFQGQNNAGVKAREYLENLGYDGVNNENEEFIAFNSNQIKLADNLAPTENEDIRFSRDIEYEQGDENKKAEIIEQAAKEWGAYSDEDGKPIKFYHGTKSFGFTEFDLNRMYDKRSIFLTDDNTTAQTYSGKFGARKISDTGKSTEKLVEERNKEERWNSYEYVTYEKTKQLNASVKKRLQKLTNMLSEIISGKAQLIDEQSKLTLKEACDLINNGTDDIKNEQNALMKISYIKNTNEDVFEEIKSEDFKKLYKDVLLTKKIASYLDYRSEYEKYIKSTAPFIIIRNADGNVSNIVDENFIRESEDTGNYELYVKLKKPYVIDCKGDASSEIKYFGALPDKLDNRYSNGLQHTGDTVDVANYAYNQGFDGVVFKNLCDSGPFGNRKSKIAKNVVVAFNPNAVKSADIVTYDNDGNVILPSERFSNDNDIRYSVDVDVDEFDDTDYNEIRLGKKEYAAVSSAITIRYANRYSDEIRSINYGDYKYYFIYNENGIRYYDRYNIEKYLKGMDDYEIHRKAKNNNRLSGLLEASERYDSSSLSSNENGRTAGNIDSLDREALQAERQSDRYGYREDADNDNTSKKRYSRDVDYAEYSQLKRENKHLKEVNELLKHQFELTNCREVSTNALLAAGRNIIKLTPGNA